MFYEWAGELRWVDIAKGNVFCHAQYIEQNAERLFYQLYQEDCLKKTPPEKMPLRLAYYLSEINVIHPFREGNGRAQRLFIEYLAGQNGYMVDFSTVSDTEMIEACALAFGRNYDLMNQLMQRITARTI